MFLILFFILVFKSYHKDTSDNLNTFNICNRITTLFILFKCVSYKLFKMFIFIGKKGDPLMFVPSVY